MRSLLLALLLLQSPAGYDSATPRSISSYPFAVGETFQYTAKLGLISLGSASMEVAGLDTIRGEETFHFRFHLEGGTFFFKLNDVLQSWTTTSDLTSLRFHQDFDEDGKIRKAFYEIFPDSGVYHFVQKDQRKETTSQPLDDAAFFYFVRTTPLEVGKTYTYNRYFKPEANPVTIRVLKREDCDLPDSKVTCLVLAPVVNSDGMFSRRSDARLWLTDDARRIPVQIKSKFPWGAVTLKLKSMTLPDLSDPGRG